MNDDTLFHLCQSKAHSIEMEVSTLETTFLLLASMNTFRTRPEGHLRAAAKFLRDAAKLLDSLTDQMVATREPLREAAQ